LDDNEEFVGHRSCFHQNSVLSDLVIEDSRVARSAPNWTFAAQSTNGGFGPFTSYQGEPRPDFAKVAICADLPLVVIASNGRFQPFYDIRAGRSMRRHLEH